MIQLLIELEVALFFKLTYFEYINSIKNPVWRVIFVGLLLQTHIYKHTHMYINGNIKRWKKTRSLENAFFLFIILFANVKSFCFLDLHQGIWVIKWKEKDKFKTFNFHW